MAIGPARDPEAAKSVVLGFALAAVIAAVRAVSGAPAARRVGAPDHRGTEPKPAASERGRAASSPGEIPARGWRDILWRTYEEFTSDDIMLVAAGVAFYCILALFPAIATLVSLYALFADPSTIQSHLSTLAGILPGGAVDVIGEQLKRVASKGHAALGFGFVLGLGLSLWSANAGMKALFSSLNVAYEEQEKRSFIALNLASLIFTVGAIAFLLVSLGVIVVVPLLLGMFGVESIADHVIAIMRWPAIVVVAGLALSVLYRYGPDRTEPQWRWVTWGGSLAALLWLGISAAFSWYTSHFGTYNATYGSLGAAIGFLTWIWISITIVLGGAELNAAIERQTARDTTSGGEKPRGSRGARVTDTLGTEKS